MHCKHMSVDSLREVRTMVLLSLPYPPMPVRVFATDPLELSLQGEECETTSHTLLARCLNAAAERADGERNIRRKKRQTEVFQQFLLALATKGFDMDARELFTLYCDFTQRHIDTYFEEGEHNPRIVFDWIDNVSKGSRTHAKMCEYMAAQSVLFQDSPPKDRRFYERKSYGSLLLMARDRIGHKMSEEEHAKAVEIMSKESSDPASACVELVDD